MGRYQDRVRGQIPRPRKPVSGDLLICYKFKWQVCYQARGMIDGRVTTAWVYGPDSRLFCEVGQEQHVCNVPIPEANPFFDDQFTFTIDEVDDKGMRTDRLAGAGNVSDAITVFESIAERTKRIIILRNGIRTFRTHNGGSSE